MTARPSGSRRSGSHRPGSRGSPSPRRTRAVLAGVLALVVALAIGGAGWWATHRQTRLLGPSPSGGDWWSGAWTGGGRIGAGSVAEFGAWRGRPLDVALTYPERGTFAQIAGSSWHVATYDGFHGRLVYALPLLPQGTGGASQEGTLGEVAQGRHDDVWRQVAADLLAHGRGDAIVRVGWEANGDWYPWGATAETAADYRSAFRHVVQVLHARAPHLVIDFDVACGTGLRGTSDRTAALTELYPGDDVVDIVGCDVYDSWKTRAGDEAAWQQALTPSGAVGLGDVVTLAAAHHKEIAVPEWGVWTASNRGGGDDAFFVERMHRFFAEHADVLAYEAYFDETEDYIRSSIWDGRSQNPRAAAAYQRLWRNPTTSK